MTMISHFWANMFMSFTLQKIFLFDHFEFCLVSIEMWLNIFGCIDLHNLNIIQSAERKFILHTVKSFISSENLVVRSTKAGMRKNTTLKAPLIYTSNATFKLVHVENALRVAKIWAEWETAQRLDAMEFSWNQNRKQFVSITKTNVTQLRFVSYWVHRASNFGPFLMTQYRKV